MGKKAKLRLWFSKLHLKSSPNNSTERSPTTSLCSSSPPSASGNDRQSQVHNVLLLTPVRSSRSSNSLQGTTYHVPPCSASGPAFSPISPLRLRPSAAQALLMLRSPARPLVSRIPSSSSANLRPASKKHIRHVGRTSLPVDCGCTSFSRMSRYQAMTQEQLNESAVICMKMESVAVPKWKKKKKRRKKIAEDRWMASEASVGYGDGGDAGDGDDRVTQSDRGRKDSYTMDHRAERKDLRHDQCNMAMSSSKVVLRSLSILSKEGRGLDSHPLLWDSSFTSEETFFSSFDRDRHRRSFSSSNSSSSEGIKQTSVFATGEALKQSSSDRMIMKQSSFVSADGFKQCDVFATDGIKQDRLFLSDGIKQDRLFSPDGIKQSSDVFDASNLLDRFHLSTTHPHPQNSSFGTSSFLQRASPTPPPPSDFRCDSSSATPAPATRNRANWIAALDGIPLPVIRPGFRKDLGGYGDLHSFQYADASASPTIARCRQYPVSNDGGRMASPTVVNGNQATQRAGSAVYQPSFAKTSSSSVYNPVRGDHSSLHPHFHESNIFATATEDGIVPKWAEFAGDSLTYSNLMGTEQDNGDQKHQDGGVRAAAGNNEFYCADRAGDRYRRPSDDSDLFHCLQMRWSQMNENKADEWSEEDSERDGRRNGGGCEATLRSEGVSLAETQEVGFGGCCGNSGGVAGQCGCSCGSSSAGGCRWRVAESLAVVKSSRDPLVDFRDSMVDMILENDICSAEDMEELLRCFLSLNSQEHHATIVKAFAQVWQAVFDE